MLILPSLISHLVALLMSAVGFDADVDLVCFQLGWCLSQ